MKKYFRSSKDKKIFGVCSGLAHYTNTDVVLWRLIFMGLFFTPFPSFITYIVATIVTESIEYND
jgi:phage shock protein PspC (stress-responsive transcriptional regulator)